jgi:hypothetical protein
MSRFSLRLIGIVVTFLFSFFVNASGQVISNGRALAKADSSIAVPAYGIPPPFPVIFTVKGTIRSLADGTPIENAKVAVQYKATKQPIDSSLTATDGSFSMTFPGNWGVNYWIFEVQDSLFLTKDTLLADTFSLNYPADSINIENGLPTLNVELYLQKIPLAAKPIGGSDISKEATSLQVRQEAKGSIETSYVLPTSGQIHLALYGVNGRLEKSFLDRYESAGKHEASLGISGLPTGIYFLKLQTNTHMAISKISYTE